MTNEVEIMKDLYERRVLVDVDTFTPDDVLALNAAVESGDLVTTPAQDDSGRDLTLVTGGMSVVNTWIAELVSRGGIRIQRGATLSTVAREDHDAGLLRVVAIGGVIDLNVPGAEENRPFVSRMVGAALGSEPTVDRVAKELEQASGVEAERHSE